MQKLKSIAVGMLTAACLAGSTVGAATPEPVEGEYRCDQCNGLLTLKRSNPGELHVWLGVGSGSCAGEALINRNVRYAGGVLEAPHKQGQVQCLARIEFTDKGASVTDSCLTPRDERYSTCTMLGTYTKRKQ